ncbi:probable RNA-binding protein 19 [Chironomus tepperi]|uniref:probable RNA-binding protein 19 n=1 Tax=Chironomus tepperi TaxID=113505 RepID=UPI00391F3B13
MSRLIVKNLPKVVNEQKLRKLFEQKGTVTDVQLKYKDGKFRQFGFIGYENEGSAQEAVNYFNDTFFGTSKIKVEVCATLGDESKPKSWSKYAKDSKAFIKKNEKSKQSEDEGADDEKAKIKKIDAIVNEYKEDPEFQEFMRSHAKDKLIWENDVNTGTKDEVHDEQEEKSEDDTKLANQEISDAEYMKKLMGTSDKTAEPISFEKKTKTLIKLFTIKVRNIPKKLKREELKKFFRPSKAHSVRIPKNSNFGYVGFKLERDMKRALSKDKSFLKGKQIHVYEFTHQKEESEVKTSKINSRWEEQEEKLKGEEDICESGKLFFRNLPYTVTEDDVQTVFEKYGNVVEVNVPIDQVTRKIKGFGTVTFLMPENAVQAYNELNGTMFHGRMFHLLPGKSNDKAEADESDPKNFKDKKRKELKKTATSAHNWNTLFMGTNAVAEIISKVYGKSKEEVLESSTGGSGAAVRLALGETQAVLDMKTFLEKHGVRLESFDDEKVKRSKTIILVKNLPANTELEEIKSKFEPFGVLEKVVMPPNSVTCLIKFADPSEARKSFKKLAYSKFKHAPLYLEWAPENVFRDKDEEVEEKDDEAEKTEDTKETTQTEENNKEEEKEEDDDSVPEPNTTLFIKNLNKDTVEETIREIFKTVGAIHSVQIAKKKSTDDEKKLIPLGYGFVQFKQTSSADKALKTMQHKEIDGIKIELKRSDRTLNTPAHVPRKKTDNKKQQGSTKIMVRNIPFQANANEIRQLFQVFGELKAVRLPKKAGVDQHRGFGFIDFVTKSDAKSAYEALVHSTHLYGRRLVLEWAATEEDVSEIRKRTAKDVSGGTEAKRSKKAILKEEDFIKLDTNNDDEMEIND